MLISLLLRVGMWSLLVPLYFGSASLLHFGGHYSFSAGVGWYRTSYVLRPFGFYLPRRDSAGRHQNAKLCLNRCLSCKNGKLSAARQAGEVARMVHKVGMLEWDIRASQAGVAGKVRPGTASAMSIELGDACTSGSGLE